MDVRGYKRFPDDFKGFRNKPVALNVLIKVNKFEQSIIF